MNRNGFRRAMLCVVAAALSVACSMNPVRAEHLIMTDATAIGDAVGDFAQYTFSVGFQVGNKNLAVTGLGYADLDNGGGAGDGLVDSHQVAIWQVTYAGTNDQLPSPATVASVVVPSGTAATLANNFRYGGIASPVTLFANTWYILGGDTGSTANDLYRFRSPFTLGAGISGFAGRNQTAEGAGFVCPADPNTWTPGEVWGSVNMQYTLVPEPCSLILLVTGLLAYAWRKRK